MNAIERVKMVKAMELICRNLNDENHMDLWLTLGVADEDIEAGDLSASEADVKEFEYYIKDEEFADLMDTFLYCMKKAYKGAGLYCDGILSRATA